MSDCSNQLKSFKPPCILFEYKSKIDDHSVSSSKKKNAIPWQWCTFTDDAFCSQGYSLNNECAAHSFPKSSWTLYFEIRSYIHAM